MRRCVRTVAIIFAGSLLASLGVANAQRFGKDAETPLVTWEDARRPLAIASASAGAQVAKDEETGTLRAARPGELPEADAGRPTQIIESPDGSAIAVAGDDLMNETIAVKNPDGSISVTWGHNTNARTHAEVK